MTILGRGGEKKKNLKQGTFTLSIKERAFVRVGKRGRWMGTEKGKDHRGEKVTRAGKDHWREKRKLSRGNELALFNRPQRDFQTPVGTFEGGGGLPGEKGG